MEHAGLEVALNCVESISKASGGQFELLSLDGDTVKVRYVSGQDEVCNECAISAQEIKQLLLDFLKVHSPRFTRVIVVSE